jgi:hypothetical protein
MRFVRLMAAVCSFAGLAMANGILVEPFATAQFGDGSVTPIPLAIREIPGAVGVFAFTGNLAFEGDAVNVAGLYKSDPFLEGSFSVLDAGAPTTFTITFVAPVVGGPYGTLTSNFSGVPPEDERISVDGATFEAGVGASYPTLAYDPGLALTIATCNAIGGCGPAGPASVNGSYSPTVMGIKFKFATPGGGVDVGFTGRLDIEGSAPVPEPGAMGLAALGLGSVVWLRRRQQAKPKLL